MAEHRTHSIEFKRQVVQEFLGGGSLHALARSYSVSARVTNRAPPLAELHRSKVSFQEW